jgi:exodeoxyribonuclease V alpha subunit
VDQEKLLEMTGTVEQLVFRNEKNGYSVVELNSGGELVTVVGEIPGVSVGEGLHVVGNWINSANYGTQFKAEAFERSSPETASAVLKYLSSGAVKGVGPGTAQKIVDLFGETALQVMEKEPERLCAIRGITKERAEKISGELIRLGGMREMMAKMGGLGITPEEAVRIWKIFGSDADQRIAENPYCLCSEGLDIGFDRADRIAAAMERPQDDILRVRAGLLHVLRHNLGNGHTCLPSDRLSATAAKMLGVGLEQASEALNSLERDDSVLSREISERTFTFLPDQYQSEVYISGRMRMMLHYPAPPVVGVDSMISDIESTDGLQYAEGQRQAVREALSKGLLILTGGPGTGKTTALNAMIRILELSGEKVFLAAPTGRAAKRMTDLTGREAKTIHRLLQVEWDGNDRPVFARNEKNILECSALIIDELSMVDTQLFEAVLRALPLGCRLILVGDCDQLPSVGAGNVLGDLIASGLFPVVQLREVFRQSMQSRIVSNAHRIVRGDMPELAAKTGDFFFLPYRETAQISSVIVDLCRRRLPESYGYSPFTDIQVLCPGRKGELGVRELNKVLQSAVNPPQKEKKEVSLNGVLFREGDKVMQVKNDYEMIWSRADGTAGEGVYNGDLGVITGINREAGVIAVQMDDRSVLYEAEKLQELELA